MFRSHIAFLVCIFFVLTGNAQSTRQIGLLPSMNVNKKLSGDWALNFKAETRQAIYQEDFGFDYLLTDLSMAAAKKTGINTTVISGYLMRTDNDEVRHRTFQQIAFVRRYAGFRLSHRFGADQTFRSSDNAVFRFRYRVSSEIPLEGQSLDPKEFFLKFNNEYLNIFNSDEYDLEIRGAAFLGYVFTPANKLEFGLDYRVDSFLHHNTRQRIWIGLNFYQSI